MVEVTAILQIAHSGSMIIWHEQFGTQQFGVDNLVHNYSARTIWHGVNSTCDNLACDNWLSDNLHCIQF